MRKRTTPKIDRAKGVTSSPQQQRTVPQWLSFAVTAGAFGALLWLERRRPLRRSVESKLMRDARNLAVASAGAIVAGLAERPAALRAAKRVEARGQGLLKKLSLPARLEALLAVLLLDYTLYLWHYLVHRVPFLWRFHVVHHIDLDMDASTALRFHFAELLISVPFRVAQVRFIGVSPRAFTVWQTLLFPSVLFHHSNVRLPVKVERVLNRFVVTPRMHGIHHSTLREETDSNWSSGLTVWDYLHSTLRLNVPQDEITIGVPAYREPEEVALMKLLKLPFVEQRPTWEAPTGEPSARREIKTSSAPDQLSA